MHNCSERGTDGTRKVRKEVSYRDAAQHLKSAQFASNQAAHLSMSSARFQSVNIEKYSDLDSEIILSHY